MANALDFFSLPMSAGPRDIAVGMDELGRPVRRTVLGREYRQAPPAAAEMQGPPPPPKRSPFVRALMPAGNWNALFQGAMEGMTAPGRAARGEPVTYGDVAATALDWGVMAAPVGAATMPDNALGIFAGRRGASPRQLEDLARAEALEAAGKSRDDIWRETGWGRGVDGRWRFEIDDSQSALTDYGRGAIDMNRERSGRLPTIMEHADLDAAYGPRIGEVDGGQFSLCQWRVLS
jgi:hypothetical protein